MGARPSKGDMDGVKYDYTELHVLETIDPEIGFGGATVPFKFGTSENIHMFRNGNVKQGDRIEADIMTITNGRGASKRIITAIRLNKPAP